MWIVRSEGEWCKGMNVDEPCESFAGPNRMDANLINYINATDVNNQTK